MRSPTAEHGAASWLGKSPSTAASLLGCRGMCTGTGPKSCSPWTVASPHWWCGDSPAPGAKVAAGDRVALVMGRGQHPLSRLGRLLGSPCSGLPVPSIRGDAPLAVFPEKFAGGLPSAAQGFISWFLNEVGNPSGPRSVQSLPLRDTWKRKRWRESVA